MGRVALGAVTAVACAVAVVALHHVFVTTATGQLLDDASLVGGRIGKDRVRGVASAVLGLVSVVGVVLSVVLVLVIGVARRRPWRAALAAVLVVGPTATTQLLKHHLLERPSIADVYVSGTVENTLPSGHTTFAGALSAGVVLVLPPRARPLGALVAAAYTATTGVATVAAGWHRASDVVAAVAVVGAWLGLAAAAVAWRNARAPQAEVDPRSVSGWRAVVPALTAVAVVGGGVAALALVALAGQGQVVGRPWLALAYAGGAAGIAASSAAVFLAALLVMRPPRRTARRALGVPVAPTTAPPPVPTTVPPPVPTTTLPTTPPTAARAGATTGERVGAHRRR